MGIYEWSRVQKEEPDAWEVMDPWINRTKPGFRKKGNDNRYVESLVMVPHTPSSELKSRINKIEMGLRNLTRFKYVEEMGRTIREMVVRKDPDPKHCGRSNCFTCKEKPGACMRAGIVYRITCMTCKQGGQDTVYIGESARTSWDRGVEHLYALEKGNLESPLVEHAEEDHPQAPRDFKMEVLQFTSRNLIRQATEAMQIRKHRNSKVINRKGEWGENLPPKLTIEEDNKVSQPKQKRKARPQDPASQPHSKKGANKSSSEGEDLPLKRRRLDPPKASRTTSIPAQTEKPVQEKLKLEPICSMTPSFNSLMGKSKHNAAHQSKSNSKREPTATSGLAAPGRKSGVKDEGEIGGLERSNAKSDKSRIKESSTISLTPKIQRQGTQHTEEDQGQT